MINVASTLIPAPQLLIWHAQETKRGSVAKGVRKDAAAWQLHGSTVVRTRSRPRLGGVFFGPIDKIITIVVGEQYWPGCALFCFCSFLFVAICVLSPLDIDEVFRSRIICKKDGLWIY